MEWISVDNRLPDPEVRNDPYRNNFVLYVDGGKSHKYMRWGMYSGDGIWFGDGGFRFSAFDPPGIHKITHWAMIPDPPM